MSAVAFGLFVAASWWILTESLVLAAGRVLRRIL